MPEFNLGTARGKIEIDASGAERDLNRVASASDKAGDRMDKSGQSMQKVGRTAGLLGAAILGGFAVAINAAANFEQRMSAIGAVTDASGADMDKLREKAMQLGADTQFSAGEAAEAIEELAKAGLPIGDILGGAADAAVYLAAAGAIPLARAAEIAAAAMNTFGIEAKDLPEVADILASAANASAADVEQLAQSLQQAGAVANIVGLSFKDTVLGLSLFANAGLKGSDAGTSMKTMLQNLIPVTEKETNLMRTLGIITADGSNRFFDQTGKVKTLAEIQGVLKGALEGQSDAQKLATLQTIFGSDAVRGAAILTDASTESVAKLSGELSKKGEAERVAKARTDNLKGSLEELKGSLETGAITAGSVFLPALKFLADVMTVVVNAFAGLPGPVQAIIGGLIVAIGVVLAVGGAVLFFRGKLIELQAELLKVAGSSKVASAGIAHMGAAMGLLSRAALIVGIFTALEAGLDAIVPSAEKSAVAVTKSATALKTFESELKKLQNPSGFEQVAANVQKAIGGGAFEALGDTMDKTRIKSEKFFQTLVDESPAAAQTVINDMQAAGQNTDAFNDILNKSVEKQAEFADAQKQVTDKVTAQTGASRSAEGAQTSLNAEVQRATDLLKAYDDTIKGLQNTMLGAFDATTAYEGAIDEMTASLVTNGATLDANTEQGRLNRTQLSGLVSSIYEVVEAQAQNGEIANTSAAKQQALITKLTDMQNRFPGLRAEIQRHIDGIKAIPTNANTNVGVPGAVTSTQSVHDLAGKVLGLPPSRDVRITTNADQVTESIKTLNKFLGALTGGNLQIPYPPGTPGRAHGGPVKRRQPYIVGEAGPEFFIPGMSGMIIPSLDSLLSLVAKQHKRFGDVVSMSSPVGSNGVDARRANVLSPVLPSSPPAPPTPLVEKHNHYHISLAQTEMNDQDLINLVGRLEMLYGN